MHRQRKFPAALETINKAVDRTPSLLSAYFLRADILLELNDIPDAERDLAEINKLLEDKGGFSEGDEARTDELAIRILIEKTQFRLAKQKIDTSAFLPNKVGSRLSDHLAKGIGLVPSAADHKLKEWAKNRNDSSAKSRK
jgi:tetratricopeptide (TPR) repeat protein